MDKRDYLEQNIERLLGSVEPELRLPEAKKQEILTELARQDSTSYRSGLWKALIVRNWAKFAAVAVLIIVVLVGAVLLWNNSTQEKEQVAIQQEETTEGVSENKIQAITPEFVEQASTPHKEFVADEAFESLKVSKNLDAFLKQGEPNYNMLLAARAAKPKFKPMFMEKPKPVPKKLLQEPERTVRVRASEALTKLTVQEGAVARKKIKKDVEQAVESGKPIAHWAFEEGRGSTVYDWAGNNDGTVHGAKWTTGKIGRALSFDGEDDYVSILDATDPVAYTTIAWVNPNSVSAQGIIVRTSPRGPAREWSHQLLLSSSGKFVHYLYCADGTALAVTSDRPIAVDTWYHVAAVAENNGNMRLFVNGEERGTAQRIGWLWRGGDRWYIGSNASGLGYFKGIIDEVAIYNRALSAEEIRQLYKDGSPDQVKPSPRKAAEPLVWLVTMTPLGVMFEFRPPVRSSGWVDMELYEHSGEMLAAFSCPHSGEPIQIWLAEPVDEKDPAKYYLRYRIKTTAAPLPKWRVIGLSRMPKTTGTTSGSDSGQPQHKPPEPKSVNTSEESTILGLLPHGEVKDGLAAFLLCHRDRFKVGEPIPLTYGIINVGSGLEWETNLQKAEEHSKLETRVWWLRTNPELQYNYSWFEVTGPGGKKVPYHGSTGTLRNLTAAVVDKFSVVLYHRQFVGKHYPDLRGPLASDPKHLRHYFDLTKPGTYKVRWGYNPWFEGGPWTGELMSNEVQFEIVAGNEDRDVSSSTTVPAKDSEYAAIETTVSLLISPAKAQRAEGEKRLQAHGEEYLDILIKDLRSPMLSKRGDAAKLIRALVSPWARGILAGDKHHGQIELFKPRRPTSRSALHPKAENIRQALLVSLDELLEQGRGIGTPETWKKLGPDQCILILDTIEALCLCLSEFGNDETASHLAGILAKEKDNHLCVPVMRCMETIYGLPPSFRGFVLKCGNISEEMKNQIHREQNAQCEQAKAALVAWHKEHVKDDQDARMRAALARWDGYFAPTCPHCRWQIFRWNPFGSNRHWLLRFEPIIRMGEHVVPLLKNMQAATGDLDSKANYEIVIATITGRADKALVRELFAGSHLQITMACAIITAAGNTDWKDELDRLQYRPGFTGNTASHTLAVCHRRSVLDLLKKAAESNESNYTAKYAVLELQSWEE